MSRTFTDDDLRTWEAFATTGHFGLASEPRIAFNCLTDPDVPPRFVERPGADEAQVEAEAMDADEATLRQLLRQSQPLE
jgi:hypothetical protein